MKRITTMAVVLGLFAGATSALASERLQPAVAQAQEPQALQADQRLQPAAMSDEQLDSVSAGLLDGINVILVDVVDVNNNDVLVQVNLPVSAAVAAFGSNAGSAAAARPGRVFQ